MTRRWRDDEGSVAVETVILVPAVALFLLLIIFGGRVAVARNTVEAAAADAARAASLARTSSQARADAAGTAASSLTNSALRCASRDVRVDTAGFAAPAGTPASVQVTVVCLVRTGDLALPGVPGTVRVEATMSSPLDTYRGRK